MATKNKAASNTNDKAFIEKALSSGIFKQASQTSFSGIFDNDYKSDKDFENAVKDRISQSYATYGNSPAFRQDLVDIDAQFKKSKYANDSNKHKILNDTSSAIYTESYLAKIQENPTIANYNSFVALTNDKSLPFNLSEYNGNDSLATASAIMYKNNKNFNMDNDAYAKKIFGDEENEIKKLKATRDEKRKEADNLSRPVVNMGVWDRPSPSYNATQDNMMKKGNIINDEITPLNQEIAWRESNLYSQKMYYELSRKGDFDEKSRYIEGKTPTLNFGDDKAVRLGLIESVSEERKKELDKLGYDNLGYTPEQKKVAYYIANTNTKGKDAAQEYIDILKGMTSINSANYLKVRDGELLGTKLGYQVLAGVDSLYNIPSEIKNTFTGNTEYKAQDVTTSVADNLASEAKGAEKIILGGTRAITEILPSIGVSVATGGAGSGSIVAKVGGLVAKGIFAGNVYAKSYREAVNSGYSYGESVGFGVGSAALELGLEQLSGWTIGGSSPKLSFRGKIATKFHDIFKASPKLRALAATTSKFAETFAGEFTEEYLADVFNPVIRNVFLGENNEFKLYSDEYVESGLIGGFTGLILGSPSFISSVAKTFKPGSYGTNTAFYLNAADSVLEGEMFKANSKVFEGMNKKQKSKAIKGYRTQKLKQAAYDTIFGHIAKGITDKLPLSDITHNIRSEGLDVDTYTDFIQNAYNIALTGVNKSSSDENFVTKVTQFLQQGEPVSYIVENLSRNSDSLPKDFISQDGVIDQAKLRDTIENIKLSEMARYIDTSNLNSLDKSIFIRENLLKDKELERVYDYGKNGLTYDEALLHEEQGGFDSLISQGQWNNAFARGRTAYERQHNTVLEAKEEKTAKLSDELFEDADNSKGDTLDDSSIVLEKDESSYPYDEKSVIDGYEKAVDNRIIEFINRVRGLKDERYKKTRKIEISNLKTGSKTANGISSLVGFDVSGFSNVLTGNALIHIDKDHGKNGAADHSMANDNDIARIGFVVENYDNVELIEDSEGNPVFDKEYHDTGTSYAKMVKMSKKINGTYYVVEAVPNSSAKQIYVKSAYISNKKSDTSRLLNMSKDPQLTSKTPDLHRATINSISLSEKNVKDIIDSLGSHGSHAYYKIMDKAISKGNTSEVLDSYRKAIAYLYDASKRGLKLNRSNISPLSDYEAKLIYDAGKKDAESRSNVVRKKNARLIKDQALTKAKISSREVKMLEALAKLCGRDIRFSESLHGNAKINLNTGDIIISTHAKNGARWAAVHEVFHALRADNPAEANRLIRVVCDILERNNGLFDAVKKKYTQVYLSDILDSDGNFKENCADIIKEEIAADMIGYVISHSEVLSTITGEQRNALEKFIDRLTSHFSRNDKYLSKLSPELRRAFREVYKEIDVISEQFKAAIEKQSEVVKEKGVEIERDEKKTSEEEVGNVKHSLIGYSQDGKKIYKTNYPDNTPKLTKQLDIVALVQHIWCKKPITLSLFEDGKTKQIKAKFDPTLEPRSDLSKIAFGNRKGTGSEKRITLNLSYDLYQIATDAVFTSKKAEVGKKNNPAHDDVNEWLYFVTNLVYEENDGSRSDCYMNIDVKRKNDGEYFYSFAIEKGTAPQTLLAEVSEVNPPTVPNNHYTQNNRKVNTNNVKSSRDLSNAAVEANRKYMNAVNDGDVETAQKMVDEVANDAFLNSKVRDKNGKLVHVYHGTSSGGFTWFDTYALHSKFGLFGNGAYFTEDKSIAEQYTQKGQGTTPQIYDVYLNITNPVYMDANADINLWKNSLERADLDYINLSEGMTNEAVFREVVETLANEGFVSYEAEETVRNIFENMGYDGISHMGGGRVNKSDGTKHRVWIAFESDQIKSSEPVTYNDNGNVIPLSERFNAEKSDIRWSRDLSDADKNFSSKSIDKIDHLWYNEIKLPYAEQERVQSEALTWNADKRNQLITQTLSNDITYRYMIDDDGLVHVYGRESSVNIHEEGRKYYANCDTEKPDTITKELRTGRRNYSINSNFSQNGRKSGKDDTNDNFFVSGERRSYGTGYTKNRTNADRKPKRYQLNEDGSTEITYSDGTKEILFDTSDKHKHSKVNTHEYDKFSKDISGGNSNTKMLKDLSSYTKKEFKAFGWVRYNNILSAGEYQDFTSKFAAAVSGHVKSHKSKNGEFIISISDINNESVYGIDNALVFAKGTIDKPIITSVIRIDLYNEMELDVERRNIYELERRGIQQKTGELFERYYASDFAMQYEKEIHESRRNSNDNRLGRRSGEETAETEGTGNLTKGIATEKFSKDISGGNSNTKMLKDLSSYTKKEFKAFGWVRYNNILSAGEYQDFTSKFAAAKKMGTKFIKSKSGEFIIPISDINNESIYGIDNALVFAKGTIDMPIITSVIRIYADNETDVTLIRGYIYDCERDGIYSETCDLFERYERHDFCVERTRTNDKRIAYTERSKDGRRSGEEASQIEGTGNLTKGIATNKFSKDISDGIENKKAKELTAQEKAAIFAEIKATSLKRWGMEIGRREDIPGMSIEQAIKKIKESFGINITHGGDASVSGKGVTGAYNETTGTIRTKFKNDLPSVCHALGYHIDKELGIIKKVLDSTSSIRNEHGGGISVLEADLLRLSNSTSVNSANSLREGFCEFIRMYLISKSLAMEASPVFYPVFESHLSDSDVLSKAMQEASAAVSNYFAQSFTDRASNAVMTAKEWEKLNKESLLKRFKNGQVGLIQTATDSFYAIKDKEKEHGIFDLTTSNTGYVKARLTTTSRARAARILTDNFYDTNGNKIGESFFSIIEPLGKESSKKFSDFGDYLCLVHALEWIEPNILNGKKTSSGKDIYNAKAKGKVFSDDTLNDPAELKRAITHMESKYSDFKAIAKKVYEYQNNLLEYYLIPSGALSVDQAETFKAQYPHYVPFNRFNTIFGNAAGFGKNGSALLANLSNPIKKADGGNAPIRHPLESIINSTYKAVDFYDKNIAGLTIAEEFTGYNSIPGVMERVYSSNQFKALEDKAQNPFFIERGLDVEGIKNAKQQSENVNVGFNENEDKPFNPVIDKEKGIICLWKNGEKVFYQVYDRALFNSLANLDVTQLGRIFRCLNTMSNCLKRLMTMWSPTFGFGNILKDFQSFKNNTITNAGIIGSLCMYVSSARSLITKDEYYQLYKALGGMDVTRVKADEDALRKALRSRYGKNHTLKETWKYSKHEFFKRVDLIRNFIDLFFTANDFGETLPRLAEFKNSLELEESKGDVQLAFYRSQDVTTDFSRKGTKGRHINALFLFSNANIQGIDKMVRNYTEAKYSRKNKNGEFSNEQLTKKIISNFTFSLIMTALIEFINRRDEESEEEYARLSDFTKNNYFCFHTSDGNFIKIPKGENALFPQTLIQRIFDASQGDGIDLVELGAYVWDSFFPEFLPNMVDAIGHKDLAVLINAPLNKMPTSVITDVLFNRDYKGDEIVPDYMGIYENNFEKYTSNTSKFSVDFAKNLYSDTGIDISPIAIDHFLGAGGWYGSFISRMIPSVSDDGSIGTGEKFWDAFGLGRKFTVDARYSTDLLNDFYLKRDKAEGKAKVKVTGKNLMENEKCQVMSSFISSYNKQSRTESQKQQRFDRKALQIILEGFDERDFSEGENYVISLYEATGNEGVFVNSVPAPILKETKTKKGKKTVTQAVLDANTYAQYCSDISCAREAIRVLVMNLGLDDTDAAEFLSKQYSSINADIKEKYLSKYGISQEVSSEKKVYLFDDVEKAFESGYEDILSSIN